MNKNLYYSLKILLKSLVLTLPYLIERGGGGQSLILRKNHVDFNLLVLEFDLKITPPSKVNGEKSPTSPNY